MTPLTTIRKKLALIRRSPTKELLYDTLRAYVIEKGHTLISVDDLMLTVDKIAKELENRYSSVIVRKGPKTKKVVNRDLEDQILEMTDEKLKQVVKMLQVPDTSKDDKIIDNLSTYIRDGY